MEEKKITLIENTFNKSDLTFLLSSIISEKINYHKLRRLSEWEGNHKADTSFDDTRIDKLREIQDSLKSELDKMDGDKFEVKSEIIIRKIK